MPGWTVGEELGRGAFSRVLRAQRDSDGVPAALKVATPGDRLARLQLGAEARALKQVGPPAVQPGTPRGGSCPVAATPRYPAPVAAATIACASATICARCASPLKLSA